MRVLVIAEAANPEWVSVPLEGWSHAAALRRVADVHLITQLRNAAACDRAGLVRDKDFTAIDSEAFAKPANQLANLLRGGKGKGFTTVAALAALAYPHFERLVWRQFGDRIRNRAFDVVHRITPLSPTVPSPLAKKCKRAGVPFVLGPLNGGVPWPAQFDAARRKEKEWLSYVRDAYKLLPGYRSTRRNAAAIIIGSRDTWQQMPAKYADKCVYIAENAIQPEKFQSRRAVEARPRDEPLRIAFVGRLVPYKGADMLLEAATPLLRAGQAKLAILGDGPQLPELRAIVDREQIAAAVDLPGWVRHDRIGQTLSQSDVFAFPSIREFGGAVALEAMASGVVPIVVNYGGLGELVTPNTGYLVPMGTRAEIIERFRAILARLAADRSGLPAKAALGLRRALEQFTWDAKAKHTLGVYDWVTGRAAKPHYPMPTPDPV